MTSNGAGRKRPDEGFPHEREKKVPANLRSEDAVNAELFEAYLQQAKRDREICQEMEEQF